MVLVDPVTEIRYEEQPTRVPVRSVANEPVADHLGLRYEVQEPVLGLIEVFEGLVVSIVDG